MAVDTQATAAPLPGSPGWRWPALAVLPLALMVLAYWLSQAAGPYWIGPHYDPEYAYLLNSLRLAEGKAPVLVAHPGAPVQLLGVPLLHIVHLVAGDHPSLKMDVLSRPDFYLSAIHAALASLVGVALLFFGRAAFLFSGSIVCALTAQATIGVSLAILISMIKVSPEPMVLALALLMSAAMLLALRDETTGRQQPKRAHRIGILLGLMTAARLTSFPIGLVCLVGVKGLRRRIIMAAAAAAAFFVAMTPLLGSRGTMFTWFFNIAAGSGNYGAGERTVINVATYPGNLLRIAKAEPSLVVAIGLGTLGAIIASLAVRSHGAPWLARERNVLLAIAGCQGVMFLMVGKHPEPRFLLPALVLTSVSLCLLWSLAGISRPWLAAVLRTLLVILILGALPGQASTMKATHAHLVSNREANFRMQQRMRELAAREPDAWFAFSYGSASPALALTYGNYWSGMHYGPILEQLHPQVLDFNPGANIYHSWTSIFPLSRVHELAADDRLYIQMPVRHVTEQLNLEQHSREGPLAIYRLRTTE